MRERQEGAKKAVRKQREAARESERAMKEQEEAVREHKKEHKKSVLALDYNCSVVCYVCFNQDCCLNSIV